MTQELLYPAPTITNFVDLARWVNTVTNGLFWGFSSLAVFLVLFIALKRYPTEKALASAAFMTAIYTIGLRMINLVNTPWMVFFIIATALSMLYLAISGDSGS